MPIKIIYPYEIPKGFSFRFFKKILPLVCCCFGTVCQGVQEPSPLHNGAIHFMMSHYDFQRHFVFDEKRKCFNKFVLTSRF